MAKFSTGLRNKLLDTNSLKSILALGFLRAYSGPPPLTADDPLVGGTHVLLNQYSNADTGVGLTWGTSANGAIPKTAAEVWSGTAGASGLASFYRFVAPTDTGALSLTEPRIQGTIGLGGADLNLDVVSLAAATLYTIDNFSVGIPTL